MKIKILIAGDHPRLDVKALSDRGIEVMSVNSYKEAGELLFAPQDFDVFITDVLYPHGASILEKDDGIESCPVRSEKIMNEMVDALYLCGKLSQERRVETIVLLLGVEGNVRNHPFTKNFGEFLLADRHVKEEIKLSTILIHSVHYFEEVFEILLKLEKADA